MGRPRSVRGYLGDTLVVAALGVWVGSEATYFVLPPAGLSVFGRYLFPAIAGLAAIAVGCCFGAGRRWAPAVAAGAVVAVMALQWASQLLTMSSLYA